LCELEPPGGLRRGGERASFSSCPDDASRYVLARPPQLFGWFAQVGLFCTGRQRGANVAHGLALALSAAVLLALAVAILPFISRDVLKWRYVIAGACVAEAAVVAGAIALVASDSATVVWTGCGLMAPSPKRGRRYELALPRLGICYCRLAVSGFPCRSVFPARAPGAGGRTRRVRPAC
jgi:hypothetical protein